MKNKIMMKRTVFLLVCILAGLNLYADNLKFEAAATDVVVVEQQIRLSYTVNSQSVKNFRAPDMSPFEVLMGPTQSSQSSVQIINGNYTSSKSTTFTYILLASKTGTFSIPGATIEAEGEKLKSNSVTIKVLPADKANGVDNGQRGEGQTSSSSVSKVSDKDLFIVATANKTTVHEQEAVLLTYKVYTVLNLTSLQGKMPDLKGFHIQEVELPRQKSFSLEHYNGRNYKTVVWSQYVLFPQQSGKLEVPSITFEGIVSQRVQSDDPFEAFFNGGSNYIDVKKQIRTPKITLNVKSLPSGKPEGFSGAVGEFSLSSSINSTQVSTNDAVTLKLKISGTGNMKLIAAPEVAFPSDFETYDPKVDNQFSLSKNGQSGSKEIEYLAIPRHPGTYKIPAVKFSYFDLKTQQYKTLQTEEYTLTVVKGKGNADQVVADYTSKEDLKILGQDIHFIKLNSNVTYNQTPFFGSWGYWIVHIVALCLFFIILYVFHRNASENKNTAKVRTKKANKVAIRRMKQANKLLSENKTGEFYDEVLKALWGYISDKLSMPVSELSKDNIESELLKHKISEELVHDFLGILNECEFARYAPGSQSDTMDKVYTNAIDIISKMEGQIK